MFPLTILGSEVFPSSMSTNSAPGLALPEKSASTVATGPSPEFLSELQAVSETLETASPWEILQWTVDRFGSGFSVATAFGAEGMLIIHWLARIAPQTKIFNLDTGYQFPETLAMVDRVRARYGIQIELVRPELSVEQYEQANGGPVYTLNPDQCCKDRKLGPLRRRLQGVSAWASAIRRDQTPDRAVAPIVAWDRKFGLVKVSPLANWTKKQVWQTIVHENVPYNPLHDQGYPSVGCMPCTRCVLAGEDERSGRWAGSKKTECGLHSSD
ncbi:MAG: phosphoadenylyl-sulfate reductase [Planctomycetaceae bacterium]|nr:phosphoadenylyl-sulfate reductase [Planctomycetaceae bacterium]